MVGIMQIDYSATTDSGVIRLAGRFDYTTRVQFMRVAEDCVARAPAGEIRVDMGELEYIDSSALGMLLMMRDKARKLDKTIALVSACGRVREVIDTAQFDRLFKVA
jgi:anti-anti-sigma factor